MRNKAVIKDVIGAIKMALENIDVNYCKLSQIDYSKMPKNISDEKYLERPFAYEFYHQLRKLMESGEVDFGGPIIQAEVSKGYQHIFESGKIPDFLIHVPDARLKNPAVIEFKLSTNLSKLKNDFEKLVEFKRNDELKYKHGIEVIIGNKSSLKSAEKCINDLTNSNGVEIVIIEFDTESMDVNDRKIKYAEPPSNPEAGKKR